jgi:AcrR family transcriptional regulator
MAETAWAWPPDLTPLQSPVADETWERIRQVTIDLALERGYRAFEVSDVVERAGVRRSEFDSRFSGLDDCLNGTYEANIADFDQALVEPFLSAPSWLEGVRAGIHGAGDYLRDHERERRYGEIRKNPGGPMELALRDRYLQRVVDLVDVGRCELSDPDSLSRTTAEGVLGSIYKLLLDRLAESDDGTLGSEVVDEVMYLAVRRYVGDEVGMRELSTSVLG